MTITVLDESNTKANCIPSGVVNSASHMQTRSSFLQLPLELRFEIYSYLISPEDHDLQPDAWSKRIAKAPIRPLVGQAPAFAISQTCRRIHEEFFEHFYAHTRFLLTVPLNNAFMTGRKKLILPDVHFQLHKIRDVVLKVRLGDIDNGSFLDIETLIMSFPNLKTLKVAIDFEERVYIRREMAELWSQSAAVQGIVGRVVQTVPISVSLGWIDGDEKADINGRYGPFLGNGAYIPSTVLRKMAKNFEPLRGLLAL